jgi:predicted ribosome quality control (RQC) complex YloA/Tae2 family protein
MSRTGDWKIIDPKWKSLIGSQSFSISNINIPTLEPGSDNEKMALLKPGETQTLFYKNNYFTFKLPVIPPLKEYHGLEEKIFNEWSKKKQDTEKAQEKPLTSEATLSTKISENNNKIKNYETSIMKLSEKLEECHNELNEIKSAKEQVNNTDNSVLEYINPVNYFSKRKGGKTKKNNRKNNKKTSKKRKTGKKSNK